MPLIPVVQQSNQNLCEWKVNFVAGRNVEFLDNNFIFVEIHEIKRRDQRKCAG